MAAAPTYAAHLAWPKLKALANGGAVALLPVGSTEAHGPHLPLAVDVIIAEEVGRRVARLIEAQGTSAILFPSVAYSLADFAAAFPGTVTVSAEAASRYLKEVLCGIASHGFRSIAVLNHHLEPAHFKLVHEAARAAGEQSGARIVVPDHRRPPVAERLGREFTHGGSHAGFYETSLMLAAAPQWVAEDVRRSLPELAVDLPAKIRGGAKTFAECGGPDAYFGDPAAATAADGERLLELLAQAAAAAVLSGT